MEMSSQRQSAAHAKELEEENERLKAELERAKKSCVREREVSNNQNDLQTMVVELQEAKRLMEDMVRSSLSPATPSESISVPPGVVEEEPGPTAEEFFASTPPEKSE